MELLTEDAAHENPMSVLIVEYMELQPCQINVNDPRIGVVVEQYPDICQILVERVTRRLVESCKPKTILLAIRSNLLSLTRVSPITPKNLVDRLIDRTVWTLDVLPTGYIRRINIDKLLNALTKLRAMPTNKKALAHIKANHELIELEYESSAVQPTQPVASTPIPPPTSTEAAATEPMTIKELYARLVDTGFKLCPASEDALRVIMPKLDVVPIKKGGKGRGNSAKYNLQDVKKALTSSKVKVY